MERVIRTLRKLIRDYSYSNHHAFLERNASGKTGLEAVTKIYNSTLKESLGNRSPREVMQSIIRNDLEEVGKHLENEMHSRRLKQMGKRQIQDNTVLAELQKQQFLTNGLMVVRLYRPPGLFAKEVDIRVSLEVYVVLSVEADNRHCMLEHYETRERQQTLLSLCVMIKTPIDPGPPIILENIKKEMNYSKSQLRRGPAASEVEAPAHAPPVHENEAAAAPPPMMRRAAGRYTPGDFRFNVTPEIQQAVGGNVMVQNVIQAPVDPPARRNPMRAVRLDSGR